MDWLRVILSAKYIDNLQYNINIQIVAVVLLGNFMSASVSIRMDDSLFETMRHMAATLHLSQTDYIRQAIERMNNEANRQAQIQRLQKASLKVRSESMKINAEFSDIEYDFEN